MAPVSGSRGATGILPVPGYFVRAHRTAFEALARRQWHPARLGLGPGQSDPGWWVLSLLRRVGLVKNVRLPENLSEREELRRVVSEPRQSTSIESRDTRRHTAGNGIQPRRAAHRTPDSAGGQIAESGPSSRPTWDSACGETRAR